MHDGGPVERNYFKPH